MTLMNLFVGRAYAQFGGSTDNAVTKNDFTLDKFLFLKPSTEIGFSRVLNTIIGLVLTVAALAAFFYLLVAGFQYITAGGDAAKATAARTGIVNALIGIVVILVAYVVLRFVGTGLIKP